MTTTLSPQAVAAEQAPEIAPGMRSTLQPALQELLRWIFDVNAMKETMREFEIDLAKMPLGKLSKRQIQTAYALLTEATQAFVTTTSEAPSSRHKILEVTNKFYTLIPHNFVEHEMRPLNNERIVREKQQMLDSLLDIEIAVSILRGDKNDEKGLVCLKGLLERLLKAAIPSICTMRS